MKELHCIYSTTCFPCTWTKYGHSLVLIFAVPNALEMGSLPNGLVRGDSGMFAAAFQAVSPVKTLYTIERLQLGLCEYSKQQLAELPKVGLYLGNSHLVQDIRCNAILLRFTLSKQCAVEGAVAGLLKLC